MAEVCRVIAYQDIHGSSPRVAAEPFDYPWFILFFYFYNQFALILSFSILVSVEYPLRYFWESCHISVFLTNSDGHDADVRHEGALIKKSRSTLHFSSK
jgi:hypothetical protein